MKEPERITTPLYIKWLNENGIMAWRVNSGKVKVGSRYIKLGDEGHPDIAFILPGGRAGFCENKSNGSELTEAQVRWLEKARAQGAYCFIAQSLEDVVDYIGLVKK